MRTRETALRLQPPYAEAGITPSYSLRNTSRHTITPITFTTPSRTTTANLHTHKNVQITIRAALGLRIVTTCKRHDAILTMIPLPPILAQSAFFQSYRHCLIIFRRAHFQRYVAVRASSPIMPRTFRAPCRFIAPSLHYHQLFLDAASNFSGQLIYTRFRHSRRALQSLRPQEYIQVIFIMKKFCVALSHAYTASATFIYPTHFSIQLSWLLLASSNEKNAIDLNIQFITTRLKCQLAGLYYANRDH